MKTDDDFKASIKQKIEIRCNGFYSEADTMEEAQEIAQRMEREAREKYEEENSKEQKRNYNKMRVIDNYVNFEEKLRKDIWKNARNKALSKDVRDYEKEIHRILKGIRTGTLDVIYHSAWTSNEVYYTIEQTPDEEKIKRGLKEDDSQ